MDRAFLAPSSFEDLDDLCRQFITYIDDSGQDEQAITPDDRVFYTTANAGRLDNYRRVCDCAVHQGDANRVARIVQHLDLAYINPPYNQHPYVSNYLIATSRALGRARRPSAVGGQFALGRLCLVDRRPARAGRRVGNPWWGVTPFRAWRMASAPR